MGPIMTIDRKPFLKPGALALLGALALAGCGGKDDKAAAPAGGPPMPVVTVVSVHPEPVPLVTELPGRTVPWLIAEIRPQVTGIIKERLFEEGSMVEAGQLLYQIDPAPFQAAYDAAKANLARAEANLVSLRPRAQRYAELVKIDAVSKELNDDAQAALKQGTADVQSMRAALERARIDLDYTRITAPISGRIGRSMVTPGALVTANQPEALATIQQLDPIYADLTQSSVEHLQL
jgi:membrane fusion protein (multidrug efflux system)